MKTANIWRFALAVLAAVLLAAPSPARELTLVEDGVASEEDLDGTARLRIHANWKKLRAVRDEHPGAMRWRLFFGGSRADGAPTTPRWAPTLWAVNDEDQCAGVSRKACLGVGGCG